MVAPRKIKQTNVWLLRNGLQTFWLHRRPRSHAVTQPYNFGAETHLGGGDTYERFGLAMATIARAFSLTSGGSTVVRKGTWRFWPHGRDRCRSLTLTCQNSPCRQSCEHYNSFLLSPCATIADPAQSIDIDDRAWSSHGMCVNWNELQYLACVTSELQPVATLQRGYQECCRPSMKTNLRTKIFQINICMFSLAYFTCKYISPLYSCGYFIITLCIL